MTHARMIHFRHGAGDRAPSSERRLKAFDLIVVPGEKDVERAIERRHVDPSRVRIGGYVKLDYLRHYPHFGARLFDNDQPTIVYNPHFDRARSSIDVARMIVETIRTDGRYNLVFAPHIRIAEDMTAHDRASWYAMAEPGHVIVDLESDRLIDMSYVHMADIYLGDMSSQLYEFLADPRPVAFVNAHDVGWEDDPRYAGWHLGKVAKGPDDLMQAIDSAVAEHPEMVERQREAVRRAFGEIEGACERAAHIVAEAIAEPAPKSSTLRQSAGGRVAALSPSP